MVPTAARHAGIFTDSDAHPIFDPATTLTEGTRTVRRPFPGNFIPENRFDPVGKAVVALYPQTIVAGATSNHFFSGGSSADTNQYDGRLDHSFTDNQRAFF